MQQELWQVMFSGGGVRIEGGLFVFNFISTLGTFCENTSFQNRRDHRLEGKANNLVYICFLDLVKILKLAEVCFHCV